MHHGSTLLLLIASVLVSLSLARIPSGIQSHEAPTFNHNPGQRGSDTTNVFAVGTGRDGEAEGTVAHALGNHGVKAHLADLQTEAKKEWEANFVLDYSLFNYRKTIAEMTKQCLHMMEAMRDDMVYETSTIVDKEVDRVWPTLQMQGDMKAVADLDRKDGYRGPWYVNKAGEKVDQSFVLQSYYSQKGLWRNYLEHQLHRADHEIMSSGGSAEEVSHSYAGRAEDFNRASTPTQMLDGERRPLLGAYSSGEAHRTSQEHDQGSMAGMRHGQHEFHNDETVRNQHIHQNGT